jgi:hypothetical protein
MKAEKVTLIRDGLKRTVFKHVADEMLTRHGWMVLPEPPKADPSGKTLAQVKKEIKDMTDAVELTRALEAERAGANRASVIQLCEQRLSEI